MSTFQEIFAANAALMETPLTNGIALALTMIIVFEINALIRAIKEK